VIKLVKYVKEEEKMCRCREVAAVLACWGRQEVNGGEE